MTPFNDLEPGTAAKARTNMLKLPGELDSIIERLSSIVDGAGYIQAAVVEVAPVSGEKTDSYYRRVDATIKDFIREKLALPDSTQVRYNKFKARKDVFGVLYLGAQAPEPGYVRKVIAEHALDAHKVIQQLLALRLKQSFLDDVNQHYEIDPVEFNAELYIGLMLNRTNKDGSTVFEALEYELYFSRERELALKLKQCVMECSVTQSSTSHPVTTKGMLMFDWGGKRYQRTRRLNALTHGNRNYMAFAGKNDNLKPCARYENSINYHQTDCLNRIQHILQSLEIEFNPIVFEATHQVKAFLEGLPTMTNPLWLLNTISSQSNDEKDLSFINNLPEVFGASKVLSADCLPDSTQLDVGTINYLVINEKFKATGRGKNGSSIVNTDTDETLTSFWKALDEKQSNPSKVFDYYTEVKIHRFTQAVGSICQGLNVDVGKPPVGDRAEKAFNAKVEKILQELALKEAIYKSKVVTISGAKLPQMSLELVSCRRDWQRNVYIQVLDVVVAGDTIQIENSRRYDQSSQGEFNYEFKALSTVFGKQHEKPFDAIWNGAFLIHDKASNAWLSAYTTGRIPSIIGNTLFDNQKQQEKGTAPSRKVSIQEATLPYYNTPTVNKQRHSIFLQDNGTEGAWFFVASNKSTQNTIAKQSLVYNTVITDETGQKMPVVNHSLGKLFFSTFTYDIIKLRESAKTSILQKIVEIYLHN